MKRTKLSAAMLVLLSAAAGPALAQTASHEITITATVAGYCALGVGSSAEVTVPTNASGQTTGNGVGTVNYTCNSNSTIALTTQKGALTVGAALDDGSIVGVPGFRTKIEYTATAGPATLDSTVVAPAGSTTPVALGGPTATGSVTVTVAPASGDPIVAGTYTDVLTVLIAPV